MTPPRLMMNNGYPTNTRVEWNWGRAHATGVVREVFCEPVTRRFPGGEVNRVAHHDNPAYLIELDDGDQALKLHSEVARMA